MKKQAIGLLLVMFALLSGSAAANASRSFTLQDFAGRWGGVASGTILGGPFAANYILTINRDGTGRFLLDSSVGRVDASCTVTVESVGFGLATCVDLNGPFAGVQSQTRLLLTDNMDKITVWVSVPEVGFFVTGTSHKMK